MTVAKKKTNYIHHIAVALDRSGSMSGLENTVVKVIDALVADLAEQSKRLNQETRITIYAFDTTVECLIWDMDVLRAPSIAQLYKVNLNGMTSLIDATIKAIDELRLVTEIHGDHGFLTYVVTDGGENSSRHTAMTLTQKIQGLADNWTLGFLVPNFQGVDNAKRFGVPAGNVITWDATSTRGVEEFGEKIATANSNYMTMRATGVRSTTNLFGGANIVNAATVKAAKLKPVDPKTYKLVPVIPPPGFDKDTDKIEIAPYVRSINNGLYDVGSVYYPVVTGLKRNPRIAPQKSIAVLDNKTQMLYSGPGVRTMLGLPEDGTVTVKPATNRDWTVYVQSTSPNRHLTPHTQILMFK